MKVKAKTVWMIIAIVEAVVISGFLLLAWYLGQIN
jgi:hypothetical protein